MARVLAILREHDDGISSAELANLTYLSQGVARRYMRFLVDAGMVPLELRDATVGRSEHIYPSVVGAPGRSSRLS